MDLSYELRMTRYLLLASLAFSLCLAAAVVWLFVTRTNVDHLSLHRLDIVDADGQLRLAISNRDQLPDLMVDGKPVPRNGKDAGMIFFNNEGSECGGFQVSGSKDSDQPEQGLSLTFDQYHGDQNLQLMFDQEGSTKTAGMRIFDRPDEDIKDVAREVEKIRALPDGTDKENQLRALKAKNPLRAFFGKREGVPGVWLTDSQGKERLRLYIDRDDTPHIQFLDKDGKIAREF